MEHSGRGKCNYSIPNERLHVPCLLHVRLPIFYAIAHACHSCLHAIDSLTMSAWLDDVAADELHGLPMMESDHDGFNNSLASVPILDQDDVQSLFPMLSDSSFEYEGDQQLLDNPEFPFESDLSPIPATKTTPVVRHAAATASSSTLVYAPRKAPVTTLLTPRSKMIQVTTTPNRSSNAEKSTGRPTSAPRKQRKVLAPVKNAAKTPEVHTANHSFLTPVRIEQPQVSMLSASTGTVKRRRSSKSESLSTTWTEHEQNAFFSTFKNKWPSAADSSFSTLLLQRFDAISKKIKTKNVIEVRLFYTIVLSSISGLLKELDNDIDLTNPDEVRIAVWCWSKLLTDDSHKKEYVQSPPVCPTTATCVSALTFAVCVCSFQNVATADPAIKKRLSHVLLQSIIRSRRQMLKAKSLASFTYNSAPPYIAMKQAEHQSAQRRDAPRPSVFSMSASAATAVRPSTQPADGSNPEAVVHHPMVRKKRALAATPSVPKRAVPNVAQQQQPVVGGGDSVTAQKRKRAESAEVTAVDETPLKSKRQHIAAMESFVSPAPTTGYSQQLNREHLTSQTPPQSSKKKMYIKMRIVPMDRTTKACVVSTGCNPKVELKLTSTKKISEVAQHMAKKWEKVRECVPEDAVLRFYEKQEESETDTAAAVGGSWSENDRSITCFDIWKRCGDTLKSENVVVVYYAWKRSGIAATNPSAMGKDELTAARSPPGLFAEEINLADLDERSTGGGDSSSTKLSPSPASGLQQFGASMAFHSEFIDTASAASKKKSGAGCPLAALLDENDDDLVECSPNTQRLRRRITPMLVSKEEFDL